MASDARGRGLREIIRAEIKQYLRSGELAEMVGPAVAGALAQESSVGIGIQNIRRGFLFATIGGAGASITVPHATSGFAPLSSPLRGEIVLSGRPLLVLVNATLGAGGGGSIRLSARLRGDDIADSVNGLPGTYTTSGAQGVTGFSVVQSPTPGRAVVDVTADASTADGTVFIDANNLAVLLAVEL